MHIRIPGELLKLQMAGPCFQRFLLGKSGEGPSNVFLNFPGNSDTQLVLRTSDSKEQEIDGFLAFWF